MVVAREDPRRPPLAPSDNSNAPVPAPRRPRMKEVTSRYLSSPSPSTSYPSTPAPRRCASPTVTSRSAATPQSQVRRSSSVDRPRPSTPRTSSTSTSGTSTSTSTSTNTTTTTTRSLSVSFQGESFFFQTSRAKAKPTPGRRSVDNYNRPWPGAIVRNLDYSSTRTGGEDRGSSAEVSCSDTDSVSSGSNNSGSQEFLLSSSARVSSKGIRVPARFFQENHMIRTPRPIRQASPNRSSNCMNPNRAIKQTITDNQQALNAPSILSFAMEVKRSKKGEYRIEEAHFLRLLDNRMVQFRLVNSKVNSALTVQRKISEKKMYNAWRSITELRDSVALRKMKLQLAKLNMKLSSFLHHQVLYLEEWSCLEREHCNSLFGASESLKACTLRLPLVGGAMADIEELEQVIGCARDVINNTMESSTNSFLSKVNKASFSVHELARVVSQELLLLTQLRDLLSTLTTLHVKQCSLQGQILQLKGAPSRR